MRTYRERREPKKSPLSPTLEVTWSLDRGVPQRVWFQRRGGKLVAYLESTGGRPDFAPTAALLDTLAAG
jgi:hypothetical protein